MSEKTAEPVMVSFFRSSLVRILWIAFWVYLSFLLAKLTWLLWPSHFKASKDVWITPVKTLQVANTKANLNPYGYQLFGKKVAPKIVKPKSKKVPVTNLRLVLRGVFANEDHTGGAIIEERGKAGNYYRVGDKLPGDATLAKVFEDHVQLNRRGRLENLFFEKESQKGTSVVKRSAPITRRRINSPKEFVDVAARELAERPAAALASVGLNVVKDGEEEGYMFNGNNPMLRALNLKKGDIIKSVNGYPLGNLRQDRKMLQDLYESGNLEVEVVRGSTSFYVNYPLK